MSYDENIVLWKYRQIEFLENREFDKLDVQNLIIALYRMSQSSANIYKSRLERLLLHLLKYKCFPHKNSEKWTRTIQEQRAGIHTLVTSHSIPKSVEEMLLNEIWKKIMQCEYNHYAYELYLESSSTINARNLYYEYREKCLWSLDQIKDKYFFPERSGNCE